MFGIPSHTALRGFPTASYVTPEWQAAQPRFAISSSTRGKPREAIPRISPRGEAYRLGCRAAPMLRMVSGMMNPNSWRIGSTASSRNATASPCSLRRIRRAVTRTFNGNACVSIASVCSPPRPSNANRTIPGTASWECANSLDNADRPSA